MYNSKVWRVPRNVASWDGDTMVISALKLKMAGEKGVVLNQGGTGPLWLEKGKCETRLT